MIHSLEMRILVLVSTDRPVIEQDTVSHVTTLLKLATHWHRMVVEALVTIEIIRTRNGCSKYTSAQGLWEAAADHDERLCALRDASYAVVCPNHIKHMYGMCLQTDTSHGAYQQVCECHAGMHIAPLSPLSCGTMPDSKTY